MQILPTAMRMFLEHMKIKAQKQEDIGSTLMHLLIESLRCDDGSVAYIWMILNP